MNRILTSLTALSLTAALFFGINAGPAGAEPMQRSEPALAVFEPEVAHRYLDSDLGFVWGCALFEQISYQCLPDWKP